MVRAIVLMTAVLAAVVIKKGQHIMNFLHYMLTFLIISYILMDFAVSHLV